MVCHKYKIPKELLNKWIEEEDWEFDKKNFWQRPYSYRIDDAVKALINNVQHLANIQEEVSTIDFKPENLLSRVKIDIQYQAGEAFNPYKTFVIEKYIVKETGYDELTEQEIEYEEEIRYKTNITDHEVTIRHVKVRKGKK